MLDPDVISSRNSALKAVREATDAQRTMLSEPQAKDLLAQWGISVPPSIVLKDATEVEAQLGVLRGPFALKAVSTTVVHKTEVGAVRVGLVDAQAVTAAMQQMKNDLASFGHDIDSYLVETMADPGTEIVLGAIRRPEIGWVVMLGLGGTLVEILDDVSFGIFPLCRDDAARMLSQLRGHRVLDGVRGAQAVDRNQLIDTILAFAGQDGLLSGLPADVTEVDINPVICSSTGCTAVDARMMLGAPAVPTEQPNPAPDFNIKRLFEPKAIAVLGASETSSGMANLFIRRTREYGFTGNIYPVHRSAEVIEDLPAYKNIDDIPEPVDYAYVALPASAVAPMLEVKPGQLGAAQVVSSGFGETKKGTQHQQQLSAVAARSQFRFLGPNCLGMHSPRSRITFLDNASPDAGTVSIISQSGGLSVDILRLGEAQGVKFNNVLSVGNSADLTPAELTRYLLNDSNTTVIGMYLESLKDAVEIQEVLKSFSVRKPVILLAGGRTQLGAHSAASHTGALVTDHKLWPAVADQSGMHLTDSLNDFVHQLAAFQYCSDHAYRGNRDVILFGNGGGASVLGSDAVAVAELELPLLPEDLVSELFSLGKLAGSSLSNPIDAPAPALSQQDGAVAENIVTAVLEQESIPAAIILHLNIGVIAGNSSAGTDPNGAILQGVMRAVNQAPRQPLLLPVLRRDGTAATDEMVRQYAQQCHDAGFAVFDEISSAARAASALIRHSAEGNDNL